MQKKVHVVIGGDGFLGRVLVRKLRERGEKVRVIDKNTSTIATRNVEYVQKDIVHLREEDEIFFRNAKVVYHTASFQYHSKLPRWGKEGVFYRNNVIGTKKVIEACEKVKVGRIVYVSTDMVYGVPETIPVRENHPTRPIGAYGRTKLVAEKIVRSSSLPWIIVRPRLIIGPGRLGVFKSLFALMEKNMPIPLIGNGTNRYQMISVYDCADACVCAGAVRRVRRVYNLGSENVPSVYQQMQEVVQYAQSSSRIVPISAVIIKGVLRVLGFLHVAPLEREQYAIADKDYLLDIARAKRELGWQPKDDDTAMVKRAYQHYMWEKRTR